MSTTTYAVDGMMCDQCVLSIVVKVTTIDGVTGVEIERITGGRSWGTVTSSALLSDVRPLGGHSGGLRAGGHIGVREMGMSEMGQG